MYVDVYTKYGCPPCKFLKMWLEKKGVIYNEKPIEVEKHRNAFLDYKGTGFPFTVIKGVDGEKTFRGNSPQLKNYLLKEHPLL